jgi:hypothetical protein
MKNIPKICHLIWTTSSPMSMLQAFTVITFRRHNPDWKIIIHLIKQKPSELGKNKYTPDYKGKDYFGFVTAIDSIEIEEVDLKKQKLRTDITQMQMSDILRIKYLYEIGGLYSDFDMLWLKPMSEFKNISSIGDATDFEATVCYYNFVEGHHNNSNLLGEKGSPYLKSILDEQGRISNPNKHQAFNTDLLNRMYPTYGSLFSKYPRVIAIRYNTFYPYSIFNLNQLYKENDLTPIQDKGVMGIHWFNGHEISYDYYSNNGFQRDCSMTTILKQEELI